MLSSILIWADVLQFLFLLQASPEYTIWETKTLEFNNASEVLGYFEVDDAKISVKMEYYDAFTLTSVDETTDGNYRACVNDITFDDFNFTFNYVADMVIQDYLPIYGEGSYSARLANLTTTFCWVLASSGNEILDFDISVKFHHLPVTLTGFYRNSELDPILESILTNAKYLLSMWMNYQPDCATTCVLNPIFLHLTNYFIYDIDNGFNFPTEDCACLTSGFAKIFLQEVSSRNSTSLRHHFDYLFEDEWIRWVDNLIAV